MRTGGGFKNISFTRRFEHEDILAGKYTLEQILDKGEELFIARFNIYDGQGRPATTSGGVQRAPEFNVHRARK